MIQLEREARLLDVMFSVFSQSRLYVKGFSELKETSTVPMLHELRVVQAS